MTTCAPLHGMTTVLFIVCEKDELRPFAYRVKYFLYIIISIVVSSTLAIETDGINKATSRILSMVARDRVNRLLDHVSAVTNTMQLAVQRLQGGTVSRGGRGARVPRGTGSRESSATVVLVGAALGLAVPVTWDVHVAPGERGELYPINP